jgi:hypothetical protein
VHWVEPNLVAEITYLTWTADNLQLFPEGYRNSDGRWRAQDRRSRYWRRPLAIVRLIAVRAWHTGPAAALIMVAAQGQLVSSLNR